MQRAVPQCARNRRSEVPKRRPLSAPSHTARSSVNKLRKRVESSRRTLSPYSAAPAVVPPVRRRPRTAEPSRSLVEIDLDGELAKLKEVLRLKAELARVEEDERVRREQQTPMKESATQARPHFMGMPRGDAGSQLEARSQRESEGEAVAKRLAEQVTFISEKLLERHASNKPDGGSRKQRDTIISGAGAGKDYIRTTGGTLELIWHPALEEAVSSENRTTVAPWATTMSAVQRLPMKWRVEHGWRWSASQKTPIAQGSVKKVLDLIVRRESQCESLRQLLSAKVKVKKGIDAARSPAHKDRNRDAVRAKKPALNFTNSYSLSPELDRISRQALRNKLRRADRKLAPHRKSSPAKSTRNRVREVAIRLTYLRECSVALVEAVQSWRHRLQLSKQQPFLWLGVNYLLKMTTDLDDVLSAKPVKALGIVSGRNPFLLDVTLDQMVSRGVGGVKRIEKSRRPVSCGTIEGLPFARLRQAAEAILDEERAHGISSPQPRDPNPHRRPLRIVEVTFAS